MGIVTRVAVGTPRDLAGPRSGEITRTAIRKTVVEGPVVVGPENLDGDAQADLVHHGGPEKSVYAYSEEDLDWWRGELGDLDEQVFGQNLTTRGYDLNGAVVGERWRVGSTELEVVQPRIPCFKLGLNAGDRGMPRRFVAAARPGVYLRVRATGSLTAGDRIEVCDRPAHGVRVGEVFTIYHHDRGRAARLLEAPQLPGWYREWAAARAAR